ncbi:MAG TPA: polysaccharide biosynthesis tyrosine autokinase [Sphingobium sp.]|uniref:GumC family protein n=1 Tax=Sphingobium sp. TaxID=1912891 RepID=UPI002ED1817F
MEVTHARESYEDRLSDLIIAVRDIVRRKWKILAVITAVVMAIGVAIIMMMTPQFEATARVQIDPSRNPLAKNNGGNKDDALSPEALETEVSVINSLDIASQVVDKLNLVNDPELTNQIKAEDLQKMTERDRKLAVASALLRKLSVQREKLTYIITIQASSINSVKAARIANAFADLYIKTKVNNQAGTARNQVQWFQDRLQKLQSEVSSAEARVAQYRAEAGIVGSSTNNAQGSGTVADERVGPLSSQIAMADSVAAGATAQYNQAAEQAKRGGLDSVAEVRSSPVVGELRRQRAELLRSIGEIQARYGDKHPESVRVRGQLDTVDQQIKEEGERVLGSLRANAAASEAQAGSLRKAMGSLEGERARDMRAAVQADSLDREVSAKRAEYDRLSQMLLESTQAAQNSIAQAEIVGRAEAPLRPTSPNKPLLMAFTLIMGLLAGSGVVAAQEMMSAGLRSSEDLDALGLPLLASVPTVSKGTKPADLLLEKPTSIYSESFRIARASILGVRSDKPSQVIAITSALPNEGKTTTALSFARALAAGKAKTLLLDCDVRRAAMNDSLGIPNGTAPGIVEILHGEATLQEAIRPSGIENLDHLFVKEPYFSSEDLFGGDDMRNILATLSKQYDKIVLDLPPLVGLADGRFLAALADATVLVVKWETTPTKAVASAIDWLRSDGANPIGAIFTMVNSSAEVMGSLYYSKQYSSYYNAK